MEFNKLVFAGLAVGCLAASAGGSYLSVRQNQASVCAMSAEGANGVLVPSAAPGTSAPLAPSAPNAPVTESEGVISPEPATPVRPDSPPAVSRPASRITTPARRAEASRPSSAPIERPTRPASQRMSSGVSVARK